MHLADIVIFLKLEMNLLDHICTTTLYSSEVSYTIRHFSKDVLSQKGLILKSKRAFCCWKSSTTSNMSQIPADLGYLQYDHCHRHRSMPEHKCVPGFCLVFRPSLPVSTHIAVSFYRKPEWADFSTSHGWKRPEYKRKKLCSTACCGYKWYYWHYINATSLNATPALRRCRILVQEPFKGPKKSVVPLAQWAVKPG